MKEINRLTFDHGGGGGAGLLAEQDLRNDREWRDPEHRVGAAVGACRWTSCGN